MIAYLETLKTEIAMLGRLLPDGVRLSRLHWGGGTPTFLPKDVMEHLMAGYGELFNLQTGDERRAVARSFARSSLLRAFTL